MGTISRSEGVADGADHGPTNVPESPAARIDRQLREADKHTLSLVKVELLRAVADRTDAREVAKRVKAVVWRARKIDKRMIDFAAARAVPSHLRPIFGVQPNGAPYPPRVRAVVPGPPTVPRPNPQPARRAIEAMTRHPRGAPSDWIARCGNAPRGCRGELGRFEVVDGDGAALTLAQHHPDHPAPGSWVLRSIYGFGGDAERGFRVLGPPSRGARKEKIGRSPLPDRFGNVGGRLDFVGRWRGFVGQVPQPPCSIECPICRTLNRVATPPVD